VALTWAVPGARAARAPTLPGALDTETTLGAVLVQLARLLKSACVPSVKKPTAVQARSVRGATCGRSTVTTRERSLASVTTKCTVAVSLPSVAPISTSPVCRADTVPAVPASLETWATSPLEEFQVALAVTSERSPDCSTAVAVACTVEPSGTIPAGAVTKSAVTRVAGGVPV
jgi:hypothetical protein